MAALANEVVGFACFDILSLLLLNFVAAAADFFHDMWGWSPACCSRLWNFLQVPTQGGAIRDERHSLISWSTTEFSSSGSVFVYFINCFSSSQFIFCCINWIYISG